MKKTLLFLALSLQLAAAAPVDDAAAQLRAGDAVAALQTLKNETGAEAAFWRGRALITLGRPAQAVAPLQEVPQEHPLFPYAAKALLYCAWRSTAVDPDTVLPPLLTAGDKTIRHLATAALAEYHLNRAAAADADALMQHLHASADEDESLRPLLNLLNIADLRRKGEYTSAIEQCRRLERDRNLPLISRHRLRLALAEVYYAQEASDIVRVPVSAEEEEDEEENIVANGRGEETLLHFISSNPESPLLEEAFRRLMLHEAFLSGEAARERLKEWATNLRFPRRAAMALLVQQRLLNPENAEELAPDSTCVNAAIAAVPNEKATETMLLEQVRMQEQRSNRTEAALYLARVANTSLRREFLAAVLISDPQKAARVFLDIARRADEELQGPAYHNALLCALKAGDEATVNAIEQEGDIPQETSQRLRALKAAYRNNLGEMQALVQEELPRDLFIDVALDAFAMTPGHEELSADSTGGGAKILTIPNADMSDEQLLRRIAIVEQHHRSAKAQEEATESIRRATAETRHDRPRVHAVLAIHLSHLLSAEGRHAEALQVLQQLTEEQPKGELTPRARLLMARQAELIGTLDSLRRAADIYGRCAEDGTAQAARCSLRRAAVLSRIGETEKARAIIDGQLKQETLLRKEDRLIAYAVLANILLQEGTEESLQAAVHAASCMLGEPELTPRHQALSLLHHGMICTRAGKNDIALGDYLAVLRMKPTETATLTERDYQTLRRAAAGAVYTSSKLGRYEEAAKIAEEAAAWPIPDDLSFIRDSFIRWAQNIRKTHFLRAGE